ncbi:hypothetical protein UFOVP452_31 [uncultured Caudovirales phage]|uniref:Tail protein n=1 Tax=uncultured Caudovirales phage TaxID=2100421 RepID=A0A6J5M7M9_9CAUD|nr:hypothetical protein UFOVP452_31 [uncultured Caudovirales phage]
MSSSNRLRLAYAAESALGVLSTTDLTRVRVTGESLNYDLAYIRSEEIRDDRLTPDLIQTDAGVSGGFNFELSYGAFDDFLAAALFTTWANRPTFRNLTPDSTITQVTDSTDTFAVASGGAAFLARHLVRTSGFTNANNNGLFRVASSTATTVVVQTATLTDEAAPPAGAQIRVVGIELATSDLAFAANTITSAANITNWASYLSVGDWFKVSGCTDAVANNVWARVASIAGAVLTVDNVGTPSGAFTVEAAEAGTVRLWIGDTATIGTTRTSFAMEKVLLGQATPSLITYRGCVPDTLTLNFEAGRIATGSLAFLGTTATESTTPIDGSYDDAVQGAVMNAVSHVSRIAENGGAVGSPNWIMRGSISLANNLRGLKAVGTLGNVDIQPGDCDVTFSLDTYFGSRAIYQRYLTDTETSFNLLLTRNAQSYMFDLPRVKYDRGSVNASGRNQDVMASMTGRALRQSSAPNRQFLVQRFSEFA